MLIDPARAALRSPRLDSSIPDVVKNDPLSSIFARQETSSTASFKPETEADRTIPASSGTEPRKGKAKAANIDNKPAQVPSAAQGQPSAAASDSSSTDIPAVTYKLRLTIYQKSTDKSKSEMTE